jgi:hypothetical protein
MDKKITIPNGPSNLTLFNELESYPAFFCTTEPVQYKHALFTRVGCGGRDGAEEFV